MSEVANAKNGVSAEVLKNLRKPFPPKWRVQSIKGDKALCVAYCDARDVMNRLDEVLGVENWQSENRVEKGNLYCVLSINVEGRWIQKTDVGTESKIEKEKGEVSDALKRSAVHWGIGRDLYQMPIIRLNAKVYKNNKYPCNDKGEILWDGEQLSSYINQRVLKFAKPIMGDCSGLLMEYGKLAASYVKSLKTVKQIEGVYKFCKSLHEDVSFLKVIEQKTKEIQNGK